MPVFQLTDELIFPDPNLAEEDGLLAIGGDLSVERLLLAYCNGIFPWPYGENYPVTWASPDPRLVIYPDKVKFAKTLRQLIRKDVFEIKFDTAFDEVLENCANVYREVYTGTWITAGIIEAYSKLHQLGFAHSVEVFLSGKLVGGLYGISLGRAFFGESMFHLVSNASKVAFYYLIERAKVWQFDFIDAQVTTSHLLSLGGVEISRKEFLKMLRKTLKYETRRGKW